MRGGLLVMGFLDIDDLDDDRLRSYRISDGTRWERIQNCGR